MAAAPPPAAVQPAGTPVPQPPRHALPAIDPQRCTGCGWCVAVCGPHVLSLQVAAGGARPWGPKRAQLDDAVGCTGCALCAVRCPFGAIRMVRGAAPGQMPAAPGG